MVGAEEIHSQQPLERGPIAELVLQRDTGIVDEDVEVCDLAGGRPDLSGIGDVERERRNAGVSVDEGLPRAGVDPGRASAQCLLDQRYVRDEKKTIAELLGEATVVRFAQVVIGG